MKTKIVILLALFLLVGLVVSSIDVRGIWRAKFASKRDKKTIVSIFDTKKKANIEEIQDRSVFTHADMAGYWVLFMHMPDETQVVDLNIDNKGCIIESSDPKMKDRMCSIDENGKVIIYTLNNMRLIGSMQQEGQYLDGMITIKGKRNPVPFSAHKISDRGQ